MTRKEKYDLLRKVGFSSKDANVFKSLGATKFKATIERKIMDRLANGEKFTKKFAYFSARLFGFTAKQADRIKGLSISNMYDVFKTKVLPEAGEIQAWATKDNIVYKKALAHDLLILKGRVNQRVYLYKMSYKILSEVEFFQDKKYVTKISEKKMTRAELYLWMLNDVFPKHDEEYGTKTDPTSIKLEEAYYMTKDQWLQLADKKGADYVAKRSARGNKRKKN